MNKKTQRFFTIFSLRVFLIGCCLALGCSKGESELEKEIRLLGGKSRVDNETDTTKADFSMKESFSDADLANLKHLDKYKSLILDGTKVTDEGLKHLVNATNLRTLSIRKGEITDAGLKNLESILDSLPELKMVEVDGSKVTPEGRKALEEKLKPRWQ